MGFRSYRVKGPGINPDDNPITHDPSETRLRDWQNLSGPVERRDGVSRSERDIPGTDYVPGTSATGGSCG